MIEQNPPAPKCKYCGGLSVFSRAGGTSGFKVTAWCCACQRPAMPNRIWWPKAGWTPEQIACMPWVEGSAKATCPVCKRVAALEQHHLSPREIFGDECDAWPTVDVCRRCHERWHDLMGHPIGHHPEFEDGYVGQAADDRTPLERLAGEREAAEE
jgi:hypothetical protein